MCSFEEVKISDILKTRHPLLSIEIFPPKTDQGLQNLHKKIIEYTEYSPDFISVTCGAGGGVQQQQATLSLAHHVQNNIEVTCMAHVTCTTFNRNNLNLVLQDLKKSNIQNMMCLRGDPPGGISGFKSLPDGFSHANEMISTVSKLHGDDFFIACAGYPEGHVEAPSRESDIDLMKSKIEAGAKVIVTQFFLDNYFFLRFRDELHRRGINVPIIAGILPISNYNQVTRFSIMCGCTIPARVMKGLYNKTDDDQEKFGLDYAAKQVDDLLQHGVDGIHIFALNKKNAVEMLAPIVNKFKAS